MGRTIKEVGYFKVGDKTHGKEITGLGKEFNKRIHDTEASAWGLMPGEDHVLKVQYVYFNN